MRHTLDNILRWVKSHRENSTLLTLRQVVQLFGSARAMQEWCDKHGLEQALTEERKFRIANKPQKHDN